jgi:uncharacterized phiE125 gp8 family phage protein
VSLALVTPPAAEPITLSEMKIQCGLGPMEDTDQLREQLVAEQLRPAIAAATQHCEGICARAFITQAWKFTLDRFPHYSDRYLVPDHQDIRLPLPTFQTLDTFTYADTAGVVQDNKATGAWGYQLVMGGDTRQARLRPPIARGWPLTQWHLADAVVMQFTCGFGPTPADMPWAVRTAVKIYAQWLYEGSKGSAPEVVVSLLTPYIIDIV